MVPALPSPVKEFAPLRPALSAIATGLEAAITDAVPLEDALLAKARVLLALKRPEEALQAADRALAMVDKLGGKAEPPFTILRVRQEAMDAYLTVHPPPRADPASADTTQYYRFLFQGDMAEGQGDHGAARASYLQAQQWLAEKKLPLDPTEVARRLEKVEAVPAGQASRHTASNSQLVHFQLLYTSAK